MSGLRAAGMALVAGGDARVVVDFAPELVEGILAGRKRATTRWRPPAIQGDLPVDALATCAGMVFARLRITALAHATLMQVRADADLAAVEDLESGEQLVRLLEFFYPDMPREENELVHVFYFEVQEALAERGEFVPLPGDCVI